MGMFCSDNGVCKIAEFFRNVGGYGNLMIKEFNV